MIDLITSWREDWEMPFPFIMVALAAFDVKTDAWSPRWGSLPLIRESQIQVTKKLPNTGVILATDLSPASSVVKCSIHPSNKKPVGQRAALWALEHVYKKAVISAGPEWGKVTFTEGKATVEILKTPSSDGVMLKSAGCVELAGADKKFIPATATFVNGVIEVISPPELKEPVALRYGFLNWPEMTVFNRNGLPAFPFRTDDWGVIPRSGN